MHSSWSMGLTSPLRQGITIDYFSPQRKRILWRSVVSVACHNINGS
jgi:hypothetical protein